jgi:hypothetical protein
MKITRNNYEAFFLDYYEKSLSPDQVAELMVFLEENEDLKEEFYDFEDVILLPSDDTITFNRKNTLKKKDITPLGEIDGSNYEEYFIAALEGDLSEKESADVVTFLGRNPHTKLEYNAFRATFIKPQDTVYQDKESLKKRGLFVVYRSVALYAVSIAASILLFIGLYSILSQKAKPVREFSQIGKLEIITPGIADRKTVIPKIIQTEASSIQVVASIDSNAGSLQKETSIINPIVPKEILSIDFKKSDLAYINIQEITSSDAYNYNLATSDRRTDIQKRKPFVSRFLSSLVKKVIPVNSTEKKSFIERTVNGYNMIADRELEVEKQLDKNGNIIAYNVVGTNIEIVRKLKNPIRE